MTKRDWYLVILAAAGLGAILWWATKRLPYGAMQPRHAGDNQMGLDAGGILTNPWSCDGDTEAHYVAPNMFTGPQTVLPVRYPPRAGHELTCLIQEGFSPLYRAKPQDFDWLESPPSEATL